MTQSRGRKLQIACAAMLAAIAVGALGREVVAQPASPAIEPFDEFVEDLATAPAAAYVGQRETAVGSEAALEEMRQHLLRLYHGVTVDHSFAIDDQVFDCVPLMQQPSVRLLGLTHIADTPPEMISPDAAPDEDAATEPAQCDEGTIPMLRVTLADTARFRTLRDFLSKGPDEAGRPAAAGLLRSPSHGYAHEYSEVDNYGGYSKLSIYDPKVVMRAPQNEIFSLAQHWYVGGISGPPRATQTAEVGWQKYPLMYHTQKPVLFIYWTADDYEATGCYNLTCGAFMQKNNRIALGAPFRHFSWVGGAQHEVGIGYKYAKGNWWLTIDGYDRPIGYFPGSIYNGGQMSQFAQEIDMGGEVAPGSRPGWWSQMGSGQFADGGYGTAAYHREIQYRDSTDGSHSPKLTVSQPSPNCWTATSSPGAGGSDWGTFFYFGGPGGQYGTC
jgi:hypothetical protein